MIDSIARRLEDAAELGRGLISGLAEAGLVVVDADLRILDAEGDPYKTLDPGELVGRRVRDVIPASAWSTLEPYYRAALSGRAQSFTYDAVSAPSTHQIRIAPIREDGEVVGLMILAENVTDRVRAERALAGSERLQRSVLEVLDEGVVVVDPRRTLLQANPAALEILKLDLGHGLAHPSWWHQYGWRGPGGEPLDVDLIVLETGVCLRDIDVEVTLPDGSCCSRSTCIRCKKTAG